jgi:large subunit ribosomal protein L9
MKVMLLKDVYKLGRAGDVKKVADGYGRNYLIPQGLAVLATTGALKQVVQIKAKAAEQRAIINKEMEAVAQVINGVGLVFSSRASETGKLYGSVTTQMIVDAVKEKTGVEIARRQVDTQPIRALGEYKVNIRLTVDHIPSIKVVVYREGEAVTGVEEVAPPVQVETAQPVEVAAPAVPQAPADLKAAEAPADLEATEAPATPEALAELEAPAASQATETPEVERSAE